MFRVGETVDPDACECTPLDDLIQHWRTSLVLEDVPQRNIPASELLLIFDGSWNCSVLQMGRNSIARHLNRPGDLNTASLLTSSFISYKAGNECK